LVQQARIDQRIEAQAKELLERHKAQESQRQRQQGLGHPIISIEFQGYRFVAVRNRLYYSKKWKTFTDFLGDYLKFRLGAEWGNAELTKPLQGRHPILQWCHHIARLQEQYPALPGKIHSAPMTGAMSAYFGLSYNLYLIDHNVKDIGSRLIERLKNPLNF